MIVGWEWMWQRTKRLADLLLHHRHILAGAVQLVEGLDRWCSENDVEQHAVMMGEAKFMRGLNYVEYPLERG